MRTNSPLTKLSVPPLSYVFLSGTPRQLSEEVLCISN